MTFIQNDSRLVGKSPWWILQGKSNPGFKSNRLNPHWSGINVTKEGVHGWVKRRKPKPKWCERCGKRKPRDLTNISQKYKRNVKDFWWLCRKCHMETDGRALKLRFTGHKHSLKTRKIMSARHLGFKHSSESIEKIRQAKILQWKNGVYRDRRSRIVV